MKTTDVAVVALQIAEATHVHAMNILCDDDPACRAAIRRAAGTIQHFLERFRDALAEAAKA